jgi:transposase
VALSEEDAKRPNRERECLVGERTRIVNRMKGTLARLGIRNFKPTLRKAAERLATLHTPKGSPLPPNVSAELQRDMGAPALCHKPDQGNRGRSSETIRAGT